MSKPDWEAIESMKYRLRWQNNLAQIRNVVGSLTVGDAKF